MMNDTEKETIFLKAASHIKTLLNNVKCLACGKIIQNPQIGVCGHAACSLCWRPLKNCQVCEVTSFKKLAIDAVLLSRTRAVLQLAERFERFTGIHVLERSSTYNWKGSSQLLFKDDRCSRKYERKRVTSPPKKLHSVSQNSTPLIFPGEDVNASVQSDVKKDKPSSAEKVEGWLKAQQNKFDCSDQDLLSVSQVNPHIEVDNSTDSKKLKISLGKKNLSLNSSSIRQEGNPSLSKPVSGVKKNLEIDFDEIEVVSSEYLDEIKDNDSHLNQKDIDKSSKRSCHPVNKSVEDTKSLSICNRHDLSDNSPLKMSMSAINDIIGIQLKPLNVSDEAKNKHPWESVKKMKRVLGNKRTVKKLDISFKNHSTVTPKENESLEKIYPQTPFTIEECVTPRHATKESVEHVVLSDTTESISEKFTEPLKDCPALRRVSELSKLTSERHHPFDSSLQHLNSSRIVENILSDFQDDSFEEEAKLSVSKPSEKECIDTAESNIEFQNNRKKSLVNFFYGGKLGKKISTIKNIKIPFYYKSNCISKDWYRAPQDGVNIEICRDNVVTSIIVRNQPLTEGMPDDKMKIVQTKDAQTSPIFKTKLPAPSRHSPTHLRDYDDVFKPESRAIPLSRTRKDLFLHTGEMQLQSEPDSGDKQIESKDYLLNSTRNPNLQAAVLSPSMRITVNHQKELTKKSFSLDSEIIEDNYSHSVVAAPLGKNVSEILTPRFGESFANSRRDVSFLVIEDSDKNSQLSNSTLDTSRVKRLRNIAESDVSLAKKFKLGNTSKEKMHPDNANEIDVTIQFESQIQPCEGDEEGVIRIDGRIANVDSNSDNYDDIIGSVFADIDKDDRQKKDKNHKVNMSERKMLIDIPGNQESPPKGSRSVVDCTNLKHISMEIDDSIVCSDVILNTEKYTQKNTGSNVIPKIVTGYDKALSKCIEDKPILVRERSLSKTPNMDSDNSVVEDTPQKPRKTTFARKLSQRSNSTSSDSTFARKQDPENDTDNNAFRKMFPPLDNVRKSDELSVEEENLNEASGLDDTVVEKTITNQKEMSPKKDITDEKNRNDTPLSITRFNNDVKYRSTPVHVQARRSLIYNALPNVTEEKSFDECSGGIISDKENVDSYRSPARTKSIIENEFLEGAFDFSGNSKTPKTSIESSDGRKSSILFATHTYSNASNERLARKVLKTATPTRYADDERKTNVTPRRVVLGCSCLNNLQVSSVKALVIQRGWEFSDAYTKAMTHLIVKVDDFNKSQRSVKYIRALAAGSWVLSFDWVSECAKADRHIPEEPYEVLDSAGSPGPYMSRTERGKMFSGINFFCFPPFAILDVDILTEILTNAGGTVVEKFDDIKIKNRHKICLLLGELDCTQEDRFINVCMRHPVVAVNIEWALECLGKGGTISINNWLLVPKTLLPAVDWPRNLFPDDEDSIGSP